MYSRDCAYFSLGGGLEPVFNDSLKPHSSLSIFFLHGPYTHLEGELLDVIETKILRLLPHAIHSHLHQLISSLHGFLGLENSTATVESRWGLGFVYIISLFTLESSIAFSPIILYLYINIYFHHRNNNYVDLHRKNENLTENHTTPMVSEIHQ
jgi:hypothetical protein